MGFVTIPGNIKQQYLPFVLRPGVPLNADVSESKTLGSPIAGGAQCFSFRRKPEAEYKAGFALLNVCPSSLRDVEFGNYLKKDVSFQTLYLQGSDGKVDPERKLTVDDLLETAPGIQIREFLPDTRLDQAFSMFPTVIGSLLTSVLFDDKNLSFMGALKKIKDNWKKLGELDTWRKVFLSLGYVITWLTAGKTPNDRNLAVKDEKGTQRFSAANNGRGNVYVGDSGDNTDFKVLDLPFLIYYRLQSCTTTNVYELPFKPETVFDVKGSSGWGGGDLRFEGNKVLKNWLGPVGKAINAMFSNVAIQYVNWWDAGKGSETSEPSISVKFSLFNDTAERAKHNFIFVNTIAPNNMWVQYGLFQHSSCLYDVKVEGLGRYYMCKGDVKVTAKGVMRNPPRKWVLELVKKHANRFTGKKHGSVDARQMFESIIRDNLIKIPDVYEVELQFNSLLPQNFNTYLYRFSQNARIENKYKTGPLWQESELSPQKIFSGLLDDFEDYRTRKDQNGLDAGVDSWNTSNNPPEYLKDLYDSSTLTDKIKDPEPKTTGQAESGGNVERQSAKYG